MTDVDFIAIADPGDASTEASVLGFLRASRLRDLMGGVPEGQSILGHKIWTYICPEGDGSWPAYIRVDDPTRV